MILCAAALALASATVGDAAPALVVPNWTVRYSI